MSDQIYDKVTSCAAKYGLDPRLFHGLVEHGSGYQPDATGDSGKMGLTQLTPGMAADAGLQDPFDVDQNLDAGARYFSNHLSRYGDVDKALAAYSAGPGVVESGAWSRNPGLQRYIQSVKAKAGYWPAAGSSQRSLGQGRASLAAPQIDRSVGWNAFTGDQQDDPQQQQGESENASDPYFDGSAGQPWDYPFP
jgi:soluble lytic murein transglycosylase-like protein